MRAHSVLVVEDDEDIRETIADLLEDAGFEVVRARDGAEALEKLGRAALPPCCVLLDLMMPVMDGWRFMEALREQGSLGIPPIIVVTGARGHAPPEGAFRYLQKPIKAAAMLEAVHAVCSAPAN